MIEMRWLKSVESDAVFGDRVKLTLQYRDVKESPWGDLATEWKDVPVVEQLLINDKPYTGHISKGHHGIST
jgi:hypothetical protein